MTVNTDTQNLHKADVAKLSHRTRTWLISLGLVVIIAAIVGIIVFLKRDTGPIPRSIRQAATFTLYYPNTLPQGYSLQPQTVHGDSGIVFYTLANDKRQVSVSQQILPPNPPNLTNLTNFTKMEATAGKAAIGANGSSPTAIILSNTTLITINGSAGTPQDVVANIAKGMASLPE